MVYVRDPESEAVIRGCLGDLGTDDATFKTGAVQAAIHDMSGSADLKLLVVDLEGVADPVIAVSALLAACSPATGVIVVGQSNDIGLYRQLLDLGIAEYFFKPLVATLVTRACDRVLNGKRAGRDAPTGKLVLVMGVRGGSGATTIAVRTAWHLANSPPRPVLLLDLDFLSGDVALQLDVKPNEALKEALQNIERVDALFLDRGVIHITERLDVLASQDTLDAPLPISEDAALRLLDLLLQRYRYVVVEVPVAQAAALPQVLQRPGTLLLVSDGRLVSARDTRRWRERIGPNTPQRSTLHILNRSGAEGSLPAPDFARAAGQAPDVTVPDAKGIGVATNMGIHASPKCPDLERALAPVFQRVAGEHPTHERSILARLLG
jgi:pilus assembly protein CpaE